MSPAAAERRGKATENTQNIHTRPRHPDEVNANPKPVVKTALEPIKGTYNNKTKAVKTRRH